MAALGFSLKNSSSVMLSPLFLLMTKKATKTSAPGAAFLAKRIFLILVTFIIVVKGGLVKP